MKRIFKLKPCPRCSRSGKRAAVVEYVSVNVPLHRRYMIECTGCKYDGPIRMFVWSAKLAWNIFR